MTPEATPVEQALRTRFHIDALDVPDIADMRSTVLASLEQDLISKKPTSERSERGSGRRMLVAASSAAAIVILAILVIGWDRTTNDLVVAGEDPNASHPNTESDPDGLRVGAVDAGELRSTLTAGVNAELDSWKLLPDEGNVLALDFSPSDGPKAGRALRIAVLDPETDAQAVVSALSASLFDTAITSDEAGTIGGLESRVLRLETQQGTSRLGFKLDAETYLETSGLDRVFIVHILSSSSATIVVWIEATPDLIDDFEFASGKLIETVLPAG